MTGDTSLEMGRRFARTRRGRRELLRTLAPCPACDEPVEAWLLTEHHVYCRGCNGIHNRHVPLM